jgi:hypothetical protein
VLGASDILVKIVAASHCDVLTMLSFRSMIGLAFMAVWLRLGAPPAPADARVRWVSIGLGVVLCHRPERRIDRGAHLFRLSAAHRARRRRDGP